MNDDEFNRFSKTLMHIHETISYELPSSYNQSTMNDFQGDILEITTNPKRLIFETQAQKLEEIYKLLEKNQNPKKQYDVIKKQKKIMRDLIQEILKKVVEYNESPTDFNFSESMVPPQRQNFCSRLTNKIRSYFGCGRANREKGD
jgi:hypothetical protein